jgi:hypothetical protein
LDETMKGSCCLCILLVRNHELHKCQLTHVPYHGQNDGSLDHRLLFQF